MRNVFGLCSLHGNFIRKLVQDGRRMSQANDENLPDLFTEVQYVFEVLQHRVTELAFCKVWPDVRSLEKVDLLDGQFPPYKETLPGVSWIRKRISLRLPLSCPVGHLHSASAHCTHIHVAMKTCEVKVRSFAHLAYRRKSCSRQAYAAEHRLALHAPQFGRSRVPDMLLLLSQ